MQTVCATVLEHDIKLPCIALVVSGGHTNIVFMGEDHKFVNLGGTLYAIICDVMMPVMDGLECCRKLKMELQTSHIPVMLLTACSLDEQRIQKED